MPSRRAVLASSVAVLAPGCLGASSACQRRVEIEVAAVDNDRYLRLSSDPDGDERLTDAETTLARRVAREGSASVSLVGDRGDVYRPAVDGTWVEADGAYYRIERGQGYSRSPIPALRVSFAAPCGGDEDAPTTATSDGPGDVPDGVDAAYSRDELPAVDRRSLRFAVEGGRYSGPSSRDCADLAGGIDLPYPDGLADSRLADRDRVRVDWGDRRFDLTIAGEASSWQWTAAFEATRVATDDAGFREHVAEQVADHDLDGLSPDERALFEDTIGGYHEECVSDDEGDEAFEGLLAELGVTDPETVRYDGRLYRIRYRVWSAGG